MKTQETFCAHTNVFVSFSIILVSPHEDAEIAEKRSGEVMRMSK